MEAENNLQAFAYFLGPAEAAVFKKVAVRFCCPSRTRSSRDITVDPDGNHLVAVEGGSWSSMLPASAPWSLEPSDPLAPENPNTGTCFYRSKSTTARRSTDGPVDPQEVRGSQPAGYRQPEPRSDGDPEDVSKGMKFFNILEAVAKAYKAEATKRATTEEDLTCPFRVVSTERREVLSNEAFVRTAIEVGKLTPAGGVGSLRDQSHQDREEGERQGAPRSEEGCSRGFAAVASRRQELPEKVLPPCICVLNSSHF